jgi:hypothetical protein
VSERRSWPATWSLVLLWLLAGPLWGCASTRFGPLDERAVCDACNRVAEPEDGGRWPDGRPSCGECRAEAVVDQGEGEDVLEEAQDELEDALDLEIEGPVALVLTERAELMRSAKDLAHPRLRAFCQIRERYLGEELVSRTFTIRALTALPRGLLRGILAHELFHVWQAEAGAPENATARWREGSANWAQWSVHRELGEDLWAEQMEGDPDATYGEGFRRFRRLAEALGTEAVLERVRERADF